MRFHPNELARQIPLHGNRGFSFVNLPTIPAGLSADLRLGCWQWKDPGREIQKTVSTSSA